MISFTTYAELWCDCPVCNSKKAKLTIEAHTRADAVAQARKQGWTATYLDGASFRTRAPGHPTWKQRGRQAK